jgi:hypothetical protein
MQVQTLPGKHSASTGQALYAAGVVLVLALFLLVIYTFLHEGGHALVGLLFGGTLTEFDLNPLNLSAHVGIEGNFTTFQNCTIAVAGVSFPLLIWGAFVSLAPRRPNMVVESVRLIGSLAVLNTLLVWIVIPILYINGGRPGDDSTNFLNYSGVPPLVVTDAVLIIYVSGWAFYFRRIGGLRAIRDLIFRLRFRTDEFSAPAAGRALLVLMLSGSLVAASSWALSAYLTAANPLGLPAGYIQATTINLNEKSYADETIYRFTLDEPATVSLYIVLQDIRSGPLEISLIGPNGYHNTFLKFDANSWADQAIGRAKVHPTGMALDNGEYKLHVTAPKGPGQIVVSTKIDSSETRATAP